MASITIRKLDESIKARLRVRAAQHQRSMEDEAQEDSQGRARRRDSNGTQPRRRHPWALRRHRRRRPATAAAGRHSVAAKARPMIVLDTNVISELMKATPAESVMNWVAAQPVALLYTTSITQAEILHGIMLLPSGKRRLALRPRPTPCSRWTSAVASWLSVARQRIPMPASRRRGAEPGTRSPTSTRRLPPSPIRQAQRLRRETWWISRVAESRW